MSTQANLAVIILTFNESQHLPRALNSIRAIAREIFVIDSFSTDDTVEIARSAGVPVLQHPFQSQAQQFNWALDNAPITSDWVMKLDADEIVEPDLAREISTKLPNLPPEITGINLNCKTIFQGKFIKHGGRYPLTLLRIWRRGKGRIEERWMDEHVYLAEGYPITLNGAFANDNLNDLTFFTAKHNSYASREALEVLNTRYHLFEAKAARPQEKTSKQAKTKRFFKQAVYNKIPFQISAFAYFLFRYVIQLGFLDGREGFVYHVLQGFWYRFLIGAKVREMETAIRNVGSLEERRSIVARLSHQRLN